MSSQVNAEFEYLSALILAEEDWSDEYKKDELTFGKLVRAEARLERIMLQYFRDLVSERLNGYVNWYLYGLRLKEVQAADDFTVDVLISDEMPGKEDALVMQLTYDSIEAAVILGINAGETIYTIPLGDSKTQQLISQTAKENVAELVGKRVTKDGEIVDNPKAEYRISQTTRQYIRDSLQISLNLGEDQETATKRIASKIKDPKRSSMIASTEAVNAYQGGLYRYAQSAGAIGKEWQTVPGACPTCLGNAAAGIIDIKGSFPSGHKVPSAHPRDRCGVRYVWPEEL